MRFFKHSIRQKLIVLLLLSTIVPILSSIVITYTYTKSTLKDQAIQQNARLISEVRKNIVNYLDTVSRSTLTVYSNTTLDSMLSYGLTSYQNDAYLFTILQLVSRSTNDIFQVYLSINEAGRAYLLHQNNFSRGPIAYAPPAARLVAPYELFTESTHRSHAYGVPQSPAPPPEMVFTIHRPLFRVPSTEQIGLLSIDVRMEALRALCSQLAEQDNQDFYILDETGAVVYANASPRIGTTPDEAWIRKVTAQRDAPGYLDWRQEDFTGMMVYAPIETPYLRWTLVKRIPDSHLYQYARSVALINTAVAAISLSIAMIAILIVSLRLTSPLKQLISHISKIQAGQLEAPLAIKRSDEIGIVATRFQTMMDTINELILREYKLNLANKTNQLKMLQAQINPHFINNSLQSIGHLALESQAPKVYSLISSLGQMMHYSMNTQETIVPLAREFEHATYYCELQQQRFEDKLAVECRMTPEAGDIPVPKMIVQPIVENYFKHGFDPGLKRTGRLLLDAAVQGDRLVIRIEDNGTGLPGDRLRELRQRLSRLDPNGAALGESIGLINVMNRLRLYYGEAASLALAAGEPYGVRVTLTVPLSIPEEE